jgi:hypothetical protein
VRLVLKNVFIAGHQWLTLVILGTQVSEIRKTAVQSPSGQILWRSYLEITHYKKEGCFHQILLVKASNVASLYSRGGELASKS